MFHMRWCSVLFAAQTSMLILPTHAHAAPAVSEATGTFQEGESFTLAGSGFGTKSPAAPILWETFDSGTAGAYLSTDPKWVVYSSPGASYSAVSPYGGTGLSAYNHIAYPDPESVGFRTNAFVFPPTDEVYYSFMSRYDGTGATGDVYKNGRINTGTSGSALYSGSGMIAISDNYLFYRPGSTSVYPEGRGFSFALASSAWMRHQMYGRLWSPAGAANGEIWVQVASEHKPYSGIVTREAGFTFQYQSVLLGLMMANIEDGDFHDMYVDDIYVDSTQARVELCDAATWAYRTTCCLQIPSAWSDTFITASVNLGAHLSGQQAYLYVVDATGGVNSSGFPVTVGDGVVATRTAPPTNLRRVTATP